MSEKKSYLVEFRTQYGKPDWSPFTVAREDGVYHADTKAAAIKKARSDNFTFCVTDRVNDGMVWFRAIGIETEPMSANNFKVGDPVLVTGYICSIVTCTGLFGYVTAVYADASKYAVVLLKEPTLDSDSARHAEARGDFRTWGATATDADLQPLSDDAALARVASFKQWTYSRYVTPESDPKITSLMNSMDEIFEREAQEKPLLEAARAKLGGHLPMPGYFERGNKSNYPAFHDAMIEGYSATVREFSVKKSCTIEERALWALCREAVDQSSFWSDRKECRDLVKELDLDPMVDEHNDALYRHSTTVYAANGTLRRTAIKLWNEGAVILYIQDMEDADTCWSSWRKTVPNGFLITYATRRQLPIP